MNGEFAGIEHLMAGGEVLPSQAAALSTWSPEKRLAGAVLASALVNVRDHHDDPRHAAGVAEDLAWIHSDDPSEIFGFRRLCDLFDLDSAWVRETVDRWCQTAPGMRRSFSLRRDAA